MNQKKKEFNAWESFLVKGDHVLYGTPIKDGAVVNRIEIAEANNSYYQFNAFYIWKVYIDLAVDFERQSADLIKKIKRQKLPGKTLNKKKIFTLVADDPNIILQYFRAVIANYIFSFTALEAYVNFRLDGYKPTEKDFIGCLALTKKQKW